MSMPLPEDITGRISYFFLFLLLIACFVLMGPRQQAASSFSRQTVLPRFGKGDLVDRDR